MQVKYETYQVAHFLKELYSNQEIWVKFNGGDTVNLHQFKLDETWKDNLSKRFFYKYCFDNIPIFCSYNYFQKKVDFPVTKNHFRLFLPPTSSYYGVEDWLPEIHFNDVKRTNRIINLLNFS